MAIHDGMNVLARRLRMFRRDPHCYWCGVLTVLDAEGQSNHATVDHLYSKLHPLRASKHKSGHERDNVLHVLACHKCNQARGEADSKGRVFIPKIKERREVAELCSAVIGGAQYPDPKPPLPSKIDSSLHRKARVRRVHPPVKRALMDETVRGFGWTDSNGDLRPRSWEEYCLHRSAFIGEAFERPAKPKRQPICTIGEVIEYRQQH
jgi:hypothetical protein